MANKLVSSDSAKKESQSNSKILIVGIISIIVTIIVVGVVICLVLLSKQSENMAVGTQLGANIAPIEQKSEVQKVSPGYYEVNMNTNWNFQDGDSASKDAYVANPTSNLTSVYIVVTLQETEEVIYTSEIIPLGYRIEEIKLDKHLDAGRYDAMCTYHLVDDAGETVDTLSVTLTLNVLE